MENLLTGDARSVTLDAVLAPNDTLGLAIIEALKADAKYRTKLPFVTGQDGTYEGLMSVKNGELGMSVFKDYAKLAEGAALLADQLLKGQRVNIPGSVIAADIGLASIGNTGRKTVTAFLMDPLVATKSTNFALAANGANINAEQRTQLMQ
jgi:putative multiple sugar transport system substrate-binding protein